MIKRLTIIEYITINTYAYAREKRITFSMDIFTLLLKRSLHCRRRGIRLVTAQVVDVYFRSKFLACSAGYLFWMCVILSGKF